MPKLSEQARLLYPYILPLLERSLRGGGSGSSGTPGIGGSPSPHALSSTHHTGELANAQGPQFLLINGTRPLTGNLAVNAGVTIDGVDLSAHVLDPNAHHDTATVGNGLDITGQLITVALAANSGLEFSGGDLRVDEDDGFAWTGVHSFTQDIQLDANLDFIDAQEITTSSGHLTLNAFADLILPSTKTFRSADYADGIPIAGFSLHINSIANRQLTINSIKADELHVRLFVADMVRVDVGEEYWGKSMGIVYEDFTTPSAIAGTVTIKVEDSPAFGGALFSANDWVLIRIIDDSGGGLVVASIWGQVSGYVDLGDDAEGRGHQSWLFTLRQGPINQEVKAGNVIVDFGASGQGYVHLSTLDSADGPWIQIGTWAGANPYTPGNRTIRTQIGNLDSISDAVLSPTGYGMYSENAYLQGIVSAASDVVRLDDSGVRIKGQPAAFSALYGYEFRNTADVELGGVYLRYTDATTDTNQVSLRAVGSAGIRPYASLLSESAVASSPAGDPFLLVQALNSSTNKFANITFDVTPTTGWMILSASDYISVIPELRTGHVKPTVDSTYDLGTASLKYRTLYVDALVATTISGATLSGQTWSYPGSMTIDAVLGTDTLVSVANSGAGRADLSVDRNITLGGTVDGVDLSAHVANAAAHHALATGGDGITVTGQDVAVDSTVARTTTDILAGAGLTGGGSIAADRTLTVGAGDGITVNADDVAVDATVVRTTRSIVSGNGLTGGGTLAADRTLAVGAGSGISVAADSVAVDLATTSGLNLTSGLAVGAGDGIDVLTATIAVDVTDIIDTAFGLIESANNIQINLATNSGMQFTAGALNLGTPATLTVSTTNSVTTVTHSHAVTASSDVGTTPAAALLKSSGLGGLILASLETKGSIDITNGGNLYVAGSIGGASGVMVTSGDRVGFGRVADPQFTVDVNGPLRADWLIGKHAIQLDGALLLAHWDGGDPYTTNYTAEPNGHRGQVGTLGGGAIFRPAKFGKGLQAAPSKTNQCTNPSFEVDLTSWTTVNGGTWSRVTTDADVGVACLKGVVTNNSMSKYYAMTGLTVGAVYVVSVAMKTETPGTSCRFYVSNSSFANQVYSANVPDGGWQRESVTFTVGADGGLRVVLHGNDTGTYYFDAVQIETVFLTPYIDGSLSTGPGLVASGHTWSGTAHASTSSRTNGSLLYNTANNIKADRGTIMAWVYVEAENPAGSNGIVEAGNGVWTYFGFYMTSGGTTPRLTVGNATDTDEAIGPTGPAVGSWVHVACTWDIYSGEAIVYTNGVAGTPIVMDNLPLLGSTMRIGGKALLAGDRYLNGMIDDLVILDRVSPPDEIMAVYESDAPVFAESSVFTFRSTPTGLVNADENGLWMRDVNGNAVFGLYGGEAATFSWGGATLEKGDLLIGNASSAAYLFWNQSVGSLALGSAGIQRVSMSAAGTLVINDSGGSPVFTFNTSLGAEFTKPLTLGTNGGIYQGTGTFASPTTGLKIFNDGGVGQITGYNAGVEQWSGETDGRMYAGGGKVVLDATGLQLITDSGTPDASALRFTSGGVKYAELRTQSGASTNNIGLTLASIASKSSNFTLTVGSPTGQTADIVLSTVINGIATAGIGIGSMGVNGAMYIQVPSTTGTTPVLRLIQADLSEQFIEFTATSGVGNAVNTSALGAYYGRVRVSVNGTFKWLALYD